MFPEGVYLVWQHSSYIYVVLTTVVLGCAALACLLRWDKTEAQWYALTKKNDDLTADHTKTKNIEGGDAVSNVDKEPMESDQPSDEDELDQVDTKNLTSAPISSQKIKYAVRQIEAGMSPEQKAHEQEIKNQQLAEIFQLMQGQSAKFGDASMDELQEQMKMYI